MTNKDDLIAAARLLEDNGYVLMPKKPHPKACLAIMELSISDRVEDPTKVYEAAISARPSIEEMIE